MLMFKRFIAVSAALAAAAVLSTGAPAFANKSHHHRHHAKSSHYSDDHHGNYCNHGNYGNGHSQNGSCSYGTYSAWDEEWLTTSLEGDLFEIAGGKIAQSHSSNSTVKALGAKLISDHSKSFSDGAEVAKKLGIEVPDEPTPSEQWELQAVGSVSGSTFDKAYTSLEVADHKQDIKETKAELEKGCNPLVRHEAAEDLPVLEEHLKLAEQAYAAVS
jgi:putative membrane protein